MPDSNDLKEKQAKWCEVAERIALEQGSVKLDYSPDSIREVERVRAAIHSGYKTARYAEGLRGIAQEFAAYIVTVIQRHFGPAEWQTNCPSLGPETFPLQWRGTTIYPYIWCLRRLIEGPGDDVWAKFQSTVLDASKKS